MEPGAGNVVLSVAINPSVCLASTLTWHNDHIYLPKSIVARPSRHSAEIKRDEAFLSKPIDDYVEKRNILVYFYKI
jgi:hypothetical protein